MKRLAVMFGLGLLIALPSCLAAQDHGEVGVYGDYFHYAPGSASDNFVGIGGRASFNVRPILALEAEMNYDFARNYTTTGSSSSSAGASTSFTTTRVRPLTGLFGPKLQVGTGAFRAFVTGKVGFINFSTNNSGTTSAGTATGAVSSVGGAGTHLAMYPGGGIEGFFGPIGLRAEVGDEIYLNNGTYNNLRVTFGPEFRF